MKRSKKIVIGLTLMLGNAVGFAGDMGPEKAALFNVFVPDLKPGLTLAVEGFYQQPKAGNLGWGVQTTYLPVPTPQWKVFAIDPDFQPGFYLGTRYIFPSSGMDVQLNWAHLNSHDSESKTVENPTSQWISPFSQTGTPPEGGEPTGIFSLKAGEAKLKFDYDVVNLDLGKYINFGDNLQTRLFSGLEGVWIKEQLVSSFRGFPLPTLTLDNTSTYSGVGPRLGLANTLGISRGINLVSQLAGSVLIGRMQPAQYEFTGNSNPLLLVGIVNNRESVASDKTTQVVPAVDAKLGVNYTLQSFHEMDFSIEAGYKGALYINALSGYETNTNVIALDSGSLSTSSVRHIESNFSVNGPYLGASIRY